MGYIRLLRPSRTRGGRLPLRSLRSGDRHGRPHRDRRLNIYGLGYIGAQAGSHVERICEAVTTENNLLLFHVGIWTYSPVEIGNMKPDEAHPLAEIFGYVALGHGHKPYIVETPEGKPYAYNPGLARAGQLRRGEVRQGLLPGHRRGRELCPPNSRPHRPGRCLPRPSISTAPEMPTRRLQRFRAQVTAKPLPESDERRPLLELKLVGKVGFHPFELGPRAAASWRWRRSPTRSMWKSRTTSRWSVSAGDEETVKKSLAEIEQDVLHELIGAGSEYQGREEELVRLSLLLRDAVQKGNVDGDESAGAAGRGWAERCRSSPSI